MNKGNPMRKVVTLWLHTNGVNGNFIVNVGDENTIGCLSNRIALSKEEWNNGVVKITDSKSGVDSEIILDKSGNHRGVLYPNGKIYSIEFYNEEGIYTIRTTVIDSHGSLICSDVVFDDFDKKPLRVSENMNFKNLQGYKTVL